MTVLSTMACVVSSTGISRPAYADILQTLQSQFQSIYGSDAYIDPDSQDGQLLAVYAKAIDDCNATAVAVYNSFSPATSQGAALSSMVKINGMGRGVPTLSQVNLTIGGVVGTVINNGTSADPATGQSWLLPAAVVIPASGTIVVTATAANPGAIAALPGTITQIGTPTLGWQTVTNAAAATPGAAIETDAALRQRQTHSVALPSSTVMDGIIGAVASLAGVLQVRGYENDTDAVDANGLPAHSISIVTQGGVAADIANNILLKKSPGCNTFGNTAVAAVDPKGIPYTINYSAAVPVPISVAITLKALTGYTSTIGAAIQAAVAAWINGLGIGSHVDLGKLYLPAQFFGGANSGTFEVNAILIAAKPAANAAADVAIAFNQLATCAVADIALTVT